MIGTSEKNANSHGKKLEHPENYVFSRGHRAILLSVFAFCIANYVTRLFRFSALDYTQFHTQLPAAVDLAKVDAWFEFGLVLALQAVTAVLLFAFVVGREGLNLAFKGTKALKLNQMSWMHLIFLTSISIFSVFDYFTAFAADTQSRISALPMEGKALIITLVQMFALVLNLGLALDPERWQRGIERARR